MALLMALVFAFCTGATALGDPPITPPADPSVIPAVPSEFTSPQPALGALRHGALNEVNRKIRLYQTASCRWRSLMGLHCTRSSYRPGSTQSVKYANWVLKTWKIRTKRDHTQATRWMVRATKAYQRDIVSMHAVMGISPAKRQLAGSGSIEARFNQMRQAHSQTLAQWRHPPHESQLTCIHGYEGSWPDRRNPKYNGGLQMDKYFEAAYGAIFVLKYGGHITTDSGGHKYAVGGHAYLWTALEQMWAAENAIKSRGFYPWPHTAHACGLI